MSILQKDCQGPVLENPVKISCYVRDVHKNAACGHERSFWKFSLFVQLTQSDWTIFYLHDILKKYLKNVKEKEKKRIAVATSLSAIFRSRTLIFGYGDFGDTVYYDMFDQGFWKESFSDNSELESPFFQSSERPAFIPKQRNISFIEEMFRQWHIFMPWTKLYNDTKERKLIRGAVPAESIFSENQIHGFDCALLNYFCL